MAGKPKQVEKKRTRVAESRGEMALFDPAVLVTDDDERHPHHNPARAARRQPDEPFIRNVAARGVIEPVVYKRTREGLTFVVAGNRRVRAARIVNERREAEGAEPIRVKAVAFSGADVSGTAMAENHARLDESPEETAEWIRRYTEDEGHNLQEAADALGWVATRVQAIMRVRDAVPEVRDAVASGRVSLTAGAELAKQPVAKQAATLRRLDGSADGQPGPVKVREARAARTGESRKPGIKALRKVLDAHDGLASEFSAGVVAALRLALDGTSDERLGTVE